MLQAPAGLKEGCQRRGGTLGGMSLICAAPLPGSVRSEQHERPTKARKGEMTWNA
ncbi:hypothetical protein SAMN04488058_10724 [Deinococcus reticulitermitis]|uniref:Uncharacterized protein n=1 Tax=Deinococcus reticulitermitis TaxID=856736 RepID=A0A1H6Y8P5_9DEIO|nr:hypothetical protein SAMN04488058_10724 [Deinococcus reticulitermitis]